ncbi:MAG: ATP-binding protein [Bacteroides sp.]|nr:ATP-binding protein [Bacteroides sp.]MCM1378990.1 ATP-binding protein [Bacteroides sp.]MCM1445606.1 ATP-binding protein [Prevotella sp.]
MDKLYLKSQIAMRQREFPVDLISRENPIPIGSGKIITVPGVRRCGKSSKMEIVINKLLAQGVDRERILWVGFDDERLVKMSSDDLHQIIEAYREMYPEIEMPTVYIFFDEIQLIDGWEYFVMRLYKHYSKNIYISGSNATMLSSELKTVLRGWPQEEETLPLSFKEYCEFKGINPDGWLESDLAKLRNAFIDYNNEGGFPEVVLTQNPLMKAKTLQGYFDAMLLKDLVEHYKLSNIEVLRYYLKRIMSNLTKPTSIRAIFGDIKSRGLKVSKDDLYEWANYACNIFMFFRISNYSKSLQKAENSQPKYYCVDNGLRDAILLPQSDDDGKKLENTIFLQLYRNRTPIDNIFYYRGKGECDFVVQRGTEIDSLIQVTWEMSDDETRRREIDGLIEASNVTGCENLYIITNDTYEEIELNPNRKIHVIPAWRWLLNK